MNPFVMSLSLSLAFAAALAPSAVSSPNREREWRFDVSLDGRPIGEHRYLLREQSGARELLSEARFRVRILFFDAYSYEHQARERWQGDCLESLEASTNANGERSVISGERELGEFRLTAGSAIAPLDDCVQTFAYWNPSILDARRLLNPQTGEYVDVKVLLMGREVIAGQTAERYRLLGNGSTPMEIDLWYTPSRDWLALESRTPEGRRLRYERK